MQPYTKIRSKRYNDVILKVVPGHFVTPNSHINYYIDMTTMKSRQSEAMECARAIAEAYASSAIVDTIVCMDGTEVIGAYLAEQLTRVGVLSINMHQTIYIMSPEYNMSGQMIFRDNVKSMISGKHVLLLLASSTTGTTITRAVQSVKYYGGTIAGISAIFSAATKAMGVPIHSLFSMADLPDYKTFKPDNCAMCRQKEKIDAICNGFGYSTVY